MKATILQENLSTAVKQVSSFVPSSPQLPLLENILISAKENTLSFSATDLSVGIKKQTRAKISQKGEIAIPAKNFLSFVNQLPPGKVKLSLEGNRINISCRKTEAVFNGEETEDFPEIKKTNKEKKVKTKTLEEIANKVSFAAATDETRIVLTGILLEQKEGRQRAVATDGFRLSIQNLEEDLLETEEPILLPARLFPEIISIIPRDEKVKIGLSKQGKTIIFSWENTLINAQPIEGKFPQFEKIIPDDYKTRVEMEKEELERLVKTAAIFARESANIIRLNIDKKSLTINANSPQVGQYTDRMETSVEGPAQKIAFNHRFLLDYLKSIEEGKIIFEMSGPLKPGVFKRKEDKDHLHVIMPVRVQEE